MAIFSAPGLNLGGTNALFARVAANWEQVAAERVTILDYANGGMACYLRERGVSFDLVEHEKGATHLLALDRQIFMPLLPGRAIGWSILPHRHTRIALWCTHPQDSFKWLPSYHLARTWPHENQRRFARWAHPNYFQKLRILFQASIDRGGLFMMDDDTSQALADVFDIPVPHPIIPIFTDAPQIVRNRMPDQIKRLCWVGRLEDFKTNPVLAIARDVHALNQIGLDLELDIIGYGKDAALIAREVASFSNPQIRCLGQMSLDKMNRHLAAEIDVFCGHGTAILEAAKFGIPSLLADGFYFDLPAGELRYRWLHEDAVGGIGRMLHNKSELRGRTLAQCLSNVDGIRSAGELALSRWKEAHEPIAATKRIYECLSANTFTYGDFVDAGALDFDLHGAAIMAFKRWWTKGKY